MIAALVRSGIAQDCRPWPRHVLERDTWEQLAQALPAEPNHALSALWADASHVHALITNAVDADIMVASVAVTDRAYPALSPARPGAAWYERAIADLWGHRAIGGTDGRAWLDHGRWPLTMPLAARPGAQGPPPDPPEFLAPATQGTYQIPIGPIHGEIVPAAHMRLHAAGTEVVRAEARLGYTHKGTLGLMRGKSPRAAARFAARLAAETNVAHAIAFAAATETALDVAPPPRAVALRAVKAELERIANHLDAVGAVCAVVGLDVAAVQCGRLREVIARAAGTAFGHRLMLDVVIPGGVAGDISAGGEDVVLRALDALEVELTGLDRLHRTHDGLIARLRGTGRITRAQAGQFAAGGIIARATGHLADARRFPGYAPYDPETVAGSARGGDAEARSLIRLDEIATSAYLLRALLARLPDGPVSVPLPVGSGEGIGVAEGPSGDIWHWLRLEGGLISTCFARDPGWSHWPLLEFALAGEEAGDFPLILASFHLSASGVDL